MAGMSKMEIKSKESFKRYQSPHPYHDSKHFNNNEHGYASISEVGKTIISEKFPSTMDDFWFSVNYGTIINPFDFVSVENLYNTRTVGIVKELQAIKVDNLGLTKKKIQQQKDITVAKVAVMGNTGTKLR